MPLAASSISTTPSRPLALLMVEMMTMMMAVEKLIFTAVAEF
jgi:hypothetical protein